MFSKRSVLLGIFALSIAAAVVGTFWNLQGEELAGQVTAGSSIVLDDGDATFTTTGKGWQTFQHALGYKGDIVSPSSVADPTLSATWTFANVAAGQYKFYVTYKAYSLLTSQAPYVLKDGTTTVGTATVNQKVDPAGNTYDGRSWTLLGTYTVKGPTVSVTLSRPQGLTANGVIADAVRIERVGGTAPVATTQGTSPALLKAASSIANAATTSAKLPYGSICGYYGTASSNSLCQSGLCLSTGRCGCRTAADCPTNLNTCSNGTCTLTMSSARSSVGYGVPYSSAIGTASSAYKGSPTVPVSGGGGYRQCIGRDQASCRGGGLRFDYEMYCCYCEIWNATYDSTTRQCSCRNGTVMHDQTGQQGCCPAGTAFVCEDFQNCNCQPIQCPEGYYLDPRTYQCMPNSQCGDDYIENNGNPREVCEPNGDQGCPPERTCSNCSSCLVCGDTVLTNNEECETDAACPTGKSCDACRCTDAGTPLTANVTLTVGVGSRLVTQTNVSDSVTRTSWTLPVRSGQTYDVYVRTMKINAQTNPPQSCPTSYWKIYRGTQIVRPLLVEYGYPLCTTWPDTTSLSTTWIKIGQVQANSNTLKVEHQPTPPPIPEDPLDYRRRYAVADYVRLVQVTNANDPAPLGVTLIDDGDQGFRAFGQTWQTRTSAVTLPWNSSFSPTPLFDDDFTSPGGIQGMPSASASWSFTVAPGSYDVFVTYKVNPTSNFVNINAVYSIRNGTADEANKELGRATVNQSQAPLGNEFRGAPWKNIGKYTVTGSRLSVVLTNPYGLSADGVRIVAAGGGGTCGNGQLDPGEQCDPHLTTYAPQCGGQPCNDVTCQCPPASSSSAGVCITSSNCACEGDLYWASNTNLKPDHCCAGYGLGHYPFAEPNAQNQCSPASTVQGICMKCGNGVCESEVGEKGENFCICPNDCPPPVSSSSRSSSSAPCALEGEIISEGNMRQCCSGLLSMPSLTPVNGQCPDISLSSICTKCGNGICGTGENYCNCATDCPRPSSSSRSSSSSLPWTSCPQTYTCSAVWSNNSCIRMSQDCAIGYSFVCNATCGNTLCSGECCKCVPSSSSSRSSTASGTAEWTQVGPPHTAQNTCAIECAQRGKTCGDGCPALTSWNGTTFTAGEYINANGMIVPYSCTTAWGAIQDTYKNYCCCTGGTGSSSSRSAISSSSRSSSSASTCTTAGWANCPSGYSCLAACQNSTCWKADHIDCPAGQYQELSGSCGNASCSGSCGRCVGGSSSSRSSSSSVTACISEGQMGYSIPPPGNQCCSGLKRMPTFIAAQDGTCIGRTDGSFYCTALCGNGTCAGVENACNCPEDCGIGLCGNGRSDPGEECDTSAPCSGGGACNAECQCVPETPASLQWNTIGDSYLISTLSDYALFGYADQMYLVGGKDYWGPTRNELRSANGLSWQNVGSLPYAVSNAGAFQFKGTALLVGGLTSGDAVLHQAQSTLDLSTTPFIIDSMYSLPVPRYDGALLRIGGFTYYLGGSLKTPPLGGSLLGSLLGALLGQTTVSTPSKAVFKHDGYEWTKIDPDLPFEVTENDAFALGGKLFILDRSSPRRVFTLDQGTWRQIASLPSESSGKELLNPVVHDGSVWLIGKSGTFMGSAVVSQNGSTWKAVRGVFPSDLSDFKPESIVSFKESLWMLGSVNDYYSSGSGRTGKVLRSGGAGGPTCGNGGKEGTEQCDDGNKQNGDGCSSTCAVETGWICDGQPSVCAQWQACDTGASCAAFPFLNNENSWSCGFTGALEPGCHIERTGQTCGNPTWCPNAYCYRTVCQSSSSSIAGNVGPDEVTFAKKYTDAYGDRRYLSWSRDERFVAYDRSPSTWANKNLYLLDTQALYRVDIPGTIQTYRSFWQPHVLLKGRAVGVREFTFTAATSNQMQSSMWIYDLTTGERTVITSAQAPGSTGKQEAFALDANSAAFLSQDTMRSDGTWERLYGDVHLYLWRRGSKVVEIPIIPQGAGGDDVRFVEHPLAPDGRFLFLYITSVGYRLYDTQTSQTYGVANYAAAVAKVGDIMGGMVSSSSASSSPVAQGVDLALKNITVTRDDANTKTIDFQVTAINIGSKAVPANAVNFSVFCSGNNGSTLEGSGTIPGPLAANGGTAVGSLTQKWKTGGGAIPEPVTMDHSCTFRLALTNGNSETNGDNNMVLARFRSQPGWAELLFPTVLEDPLTITSMLSISPNTDTVRDLIVRNTTGNAVPGQTLRNVTVKIVPSNPAVLLSPATSACQKENDGSLRCTVPTVNVQDVQYVQYRVRAPAGLPCNTVLHAYEMVLSSNPDTKALLLDRAFLFSCASSSSSRSSSSSSSRSVVVDITGYRCTNGRCEQCFVAEGNGCQNIVYDQCLHSCVGSSSSRACAQDGQRVYGSAQFGPTVCCSRNAGIKPNSVLAGDQCIATSDGSIGTCVDGWWLSCGNGTCGTGEDKCNCPSDCPATCPKYAPPVCNNGVLVPQLSADANGCRRPPVCCEGANNPTAQCSLNLQCSGGTCLISSCTCH